MRVAVIGQDFTESFAVYILENFRRMGNEAEIFTPPTNLIFMGTKSDLINKVVERATRMLFDASRTAAERTEMRMARRILDWAPDIVVSTDAHLWPATVAKLRESGGPIVLWFPDALVNLGRQLFFIAPYDRVFLKDRYFWRYCTEIENMPAVFLPEACDPEVHRPIEIEAGEVAEYFADVAVIGNFPPNRVRLLEQLDAYDLRLWGRRFPPWIDSPVKASFRDEFLRGDQKAKVMRASKVVLNNLHFGEIEGANCRYFEAAGCGAFQVAEWRPGMDELFENEKEVVYYRTIDELKQVLDRWLPLGDERRAIGDAATARAHAEHTYRHRLEKMLEESV